jgi:hypothetical protein
MIQLTCRYLVAFTSRRLASTLTIISPALACNDRGNAKVLPGNGLLSALGENPNCKYRKDVKGLNTQVALTHAEHDQKRTAIFFFRLTLLALAVCLAANIVLGVRADPSLLDVDEQQYYNLAGDLLRGEYEFNPQRTLGYAGVLALVRLLTFDNFYATQIVLPLLSSLSAPITYLSVRRHFGHDKLALIVALMVICWGPFLYYNHSLYSEGVALPVF